MSGSPTKSGFLKRKKQQNSISDLDLDNNYDSAILGISKLGNIKIWEPARIVNSCLNKHKSPSRGTFQELKPTAATSKMTIQEEDQWFVPKKFADESIKKAKLYKYVNTQKFNSNSYAQRQSSVYTRNIAQERIMNSTSDIIPTVSPRKGSKVVFKGFNNGRGLAGKLPNLYFADQS